MEALGDGVVLGKAPHTADLLCPFGQGFGERGSGLQAAATQGFDKAEELRGVFTALGRGLVFTAQEREEPFLELVDALKGRMLAEEPVQVAALTRIETICPATQQAQPRAVPAQFRTELAGDPHQVQADHADRMEAVRDDPCLGEPSPYEQPIGVRQVNADHPDFFAAAKRGEVAGQLRFTAPRTNVEDPAPLQVTEGGHEALASVQGVLVYAEDPEGNPGSAFPWPCVR